MRSNFATTNKRGFFHKYLQHTLAVRVFDSVVIVISTQMLFFDIFATDKM